MKISRHLHYMVFCSSISSPFSFFDLMYFPLFTLASFGFGASAGMIHWCPTRCAPSMRPSVHKVCTRLAQMPHFSEICLIDTYSIVTLNIVHSRMVAVYNKPFLFYSNKRTKSMQRSYKSRNGFLCQIHLSHSFNNKRGVSFQGSAPIVRNINAVVFFPITFMFN